MDTFTNDKKFGCTALNTLAIWMEGVTQSEYNDFLLQQESNTSQQNFVDISPIDACARLKDKPIDEAKRLFRAYQVMHHENDHFRMISGTSAGLLAYMLSASKMWMISGELSLLIPFLRDRCTNGFMPILEIPKYSCVFQKEVVQRVHELQKHINNYNEAQKVWMGDFQRINNPQRAVSAFLAWFRLLHLAWFGDEPITVTPDNFSFQVSQERSGFIELLEGHARVHDIIFLAPLYEQRREIFDSLIKEMSGKLYTKAIDYCIDHVAGATLFDVAFAIDLALMPPILGVYRPCVRIPLTWQDVDPWLRFTRIIDLLKEYPHIISPDDLRKRYDIMAASICAQFRWPTPSEMANVAAESMKINTTLFPSGKYAIKRFMLASKTRRENPWFWALPAGNRGSEPPDNVTQFLAPFVFWPEGLFVQCGNENATENDELRKDLIINAVVQDLLYHESFTDTWTLSIKCSPDSMRNKQYPGLPEDNDNLLPFIKNAIIREYGMPVTEFRSHINP